MAEGVSEKPKIKPARLSRREFLKVVATGTAGVLAGCVPGGERERSQADYQPVEHGTTLILNMIENGQPQSQAIKIEYNSERIERLQLLKERVSGTPNNVIIYSPIEFQDQAQGMERLLGEIVETRLTRYRRNSTLSGGTDVGIYYSPRSGEGTSEAFRPDDIEGRQEVWGIPVICSLSDWMLDGSHVPCEFDRDPPPALNIPTVTMFGEGLTVGFIMPQADGSLTFRIQGYVRDARALEPA